MSFAIVSGNNKSQKSTKEPVKSNSRISTNFDNKNQTESTHPLIYLQKAIGNQAVQGLLNSPNLHRRPKISQNDDPYEIEAEAMVDQVMRMEPSIAPLVESTQGKEAEEKNAYFAKSAVSQNARSESLPAAHDVFGSSSGIPLNDSIRAFFEPRFAHDFSDVRIHADAPSASAANALHARAFTVGRDVAFNLGEYSPDSHEGKRLIAHELAHVALQHTGVRRVMDLGGAHEAAEMRRESERLEQERHRAWSSSVEGQFQRDLTKQSRTIGEERGRIDLALTAQRAEAIDAVAGGQGWLNEALRNRGYSGPGLAELKPFWGEALVAAETLKLSASAGTVTTNAQLAGLNAIPAFYSAVSGFALAAEEAFRAHVQEENDRRLAEYQTRLANYERSVELDRMSQGPIGEPGERMARASQALLRGDRPEPPAYLTAPPSISTLIGPARARVYAAETAAQWEAVATDVNRLGNGFVSMLVASLPTESKTRQGMEYLEQLDTRLAVFEQTNPLSVRIPAVFYPNDRTLNRKGENGQPQLAPEAIPWQFYLSNTGVYSKEQSAAHPGGKWILTDLTSTQRFQNEAPASDLESDQFRQGRPVDPPIAMFSELNSRIRFPEGRLYFTLPSGISYLLRTTEPWSLSDFLAAIGMALAAIAIVASLVATGGASAPAAVAFYAGLGAAAAGVGSTLANLHEKSEQGILTSEDVDKAMISIGIDIVTAASMGLGRLVAAPQAAARIGLIGERFIALQKVTQIVRAGALAGDVYQAWALTSGLVSAFNAIKDQPGLSEEERSRMRGQLVRRALLSGVLMTIAIRGDIQDLRAGRNLRISHIDEDGALVTAHSGEPVTPHENVDVPSTSSAAHAAAPHADVTGPVHAGSERAGTDVSIGVQSHALGVAGTGRARDFYFCSDLCGPIVHRLEAVIAVLPTSVKHPFRPALQDMLSRARSAGQRLKLGKLTQEEADAVARELSDRIGRLSNDSELFSALFNTDPAVLAAHRMEIRQRLAQDLEHQTALLTTQSERQAANRGTSPGRDPTMEPGLRSPIETDVLGGFNIQEVSKPGKKLQPIHFDVGNFSHTYAEALVVLGLPRGLLKEVPVTLPNGTVGRADRARFIYDADGDRIGAHVFEIKPNTVENIARGETQVQEYVTGLRTEIEAKLREKGKGVPTTAPDGGPLYSGKVLTYDLEQMLAVLRALRANRRDAARMADDEAIARQVFGKSQ